jgi:hypothetical protein
MAIVCILEMCEIRTITIVTRGNRMSRCEMGRREEQRGQSADNQYKKTNQDKEHRVFQDAEPRHDGQSDGEVVRTQQGETEKTGLDDGLIPVEAKKGRVQ